MTFSPPFGLALRYDHYHDIDMLVRPICEPVELPPGTSIIAERVLIEAGASDIGNFLHFHDVAELVLFRRVTGDFIADGRRHLLSADSVVFVPSMRNHDFELGRGAMEWVLIQLDPDIVENLGIRSGPICLSLDERTRERIELLADWLIEAVATNSSQAERIAELLLLAALETGRRDPSAANAETPHVERLVPAIELLRKAPGEPLTLEQAASACSVSPAYFSRRFRQLFGMTFTDYARTYRLRLAARRLTNGGSAISKIAYGVGFSSPAHFTARFRERFGMTPREYRASARIRAAAEGKEQA